MVCRTSFTWTDLWTFYATNLITPTLLYLAEGGGILFGVKWAPILAGGLNVLFAVLQIAVLVVVRLPPNGVLISVIAASVLGAVLVGV